MGLPFQVLPQKLSAKDSKTLKRLVELADEVVAAADRSRDPHMDIPARSLSNVRYNKAKRFIEMGRNTNRRQLFNLSQAKSYMQTMLVASGATQLIEQGKTTSIRGLYYLLKHTIEGAKEETFEDQAECDPVIEDVEVLLGSLREELHLYAQKRGDMVGDIVLVDRGDEIDCARMGSGGYGIPSIVEPEVIQFKSCTAKFVLHVEKDTVWQRFNEDKFWRKNNCILTHGGGQPPRGVRRLLHRLHDELKLPDLLPAGQRSLGILHLQRHQAGLDQPGLRVAADGHPRRPLPRPPLDRFRALRAVRQREDRAERHGPQAGEADRRVSLVRAQEAVAEGNPKALGQRLQAGSGIADQQGHQLRDGRVHPRAAGRGGLAGLNGRMKDEGGRS